MGLASPVGLEIDKEWRRYQDQTDHGQPQQAIGEVGIDAKEYTGKQWRELRLALAVNEVAYADSTGDSADDQAIHRAAPRSRATLRACARLGGLGLDEFNAVAEGIMDKGTFDARLRAVPVDCDAIGGELVE